MIEKYINRITKSSSTYTIHGDGKRDFEDHSDDVSKERLIDYIEYCKNKLNLQMIY